MNEQNLSQKKVNHIVESRCVLLIRFAVDVEHWKVVRSCSSDEKYRRVS